MGDSQKAAVVSQLWPLLFVRELESSLSFYRDQLGFSLVGTDGKPEGEMRWCRLERGGASIMLQQEEKDNGHRATHNPKVCFYFICDDADAMHSEFLSRGLQVDPPTVAYYGMKQLFVPEPDNDPSDDVKVPVTLELTIHENGTVRGMVGGAELKGCVLKQNRGELGRRLNVASDYVIMDGYLDGAIVAEDTVPKKNLSIPFDIVDGHIQGTLFWQKEGRYPLPLMLQIDLVKTK